MSLAHPLHLALAFVVAVPVAAALIASARARRAGELTYSHLPLAAAALPPARWLVRGLIALFALGALAFVAAFGAPSVVVPVPVKDGNVVICVDTSGSMASADVAPTRWQAARAAAQDFVRETARGTRTALIAFSSSAALVQPLTADRASFDAALAQLPPPNGATAIGDALALAGSELPARGPRVVVLITDGVNNSGTDPLAAARQLGARGIVLYTIGIGTNEGALVPGTDQLASIDEGALRAYAHATGGSYARADSASALRAALARLGRATGFRRERIDASLAFAVAGALAMLASGAAAFAMGRIP